MNEKIRQYLSKIGKKGGRKSRRVLTSEDARRMINARWEKRRKQQSAIAHGEQEGATQENNASNTSKNG